MSTTPRRLDKYELLQRLGRGGMAEVWKAFDTQLRRFVAIKLLHPNLQTDPDFMTRFVREAQVIASLHHPNIVQIHDFRTSDGSEVSSTTAYMVMDYVDGQTLAEFIRETARAGKFPRRQISLASSPPFAAPSITRTITAWCIATSSRPTSCWISATRRTIR